VKRFLHAGQMVVLAGMLSLQTRAADLDFDVRSFGAKVTESTKDTLAIQAHG